eukprot:475305-Pyramimonas_sp.AAC.1
MQGLDGQRTPHKETNMAKASWSRANKGKSPNYRRGSAVILGDLLPCSTVFELRQELKDV